MRKAFRGFDEDGDSKISYQEFVNGLSKLGIYLSDEDMFDTFSYLDEDSDGYLMLNEFCKILPENNTNSKPNADSLSISGSTKRMNYKSYQTPLRERPKYFDTDVGSVEKK